MANPNPNRVSGQVTLTIDGERYETAGSSTMLLGGPMREAVEGDNEAGAFKEFPSGSKTTTQLLLKRGLSLTRLRGVDNATVVMVTDIGTAYVVRHAYVAEVIEASFNEGKASLVLGGPPAEDLL